MAEKPVRKEAGFEILSLPFVYCTRNIKFVFIDDSILEDTNGDDSVDIIDRQVVKKVGTGNSLNVMIIRYKFPVPIVK